MIGLLAFMFPIFAMCFGASHMEARGQVLAHFDKLGFPNIRGTFLGSPNKDSNILGYILGYP